MGTDYLQLFNKEVADKILAMDLEPMTQFLELNIEFLKRKNRETILRSSVQFVMAEAGCSTKEAIATLLERDEKLSEIRVSLALDSGFSTERISLDYWGCYAEVFDGSPEGSISCLEYLPNEVEEWFILLQPSHVDLIVKSLYQHLDDLTIMGEKEIEGVVKWKNFCIANPGYMAAYMLDF